MTDPKRPADTHRDLSAIRAVAGEDETREDVPEVEREERDDTSDGDPVPAEGRDTPYDSDDEIAARARRNTEAGAPPGTTHDPNSVTTGTAAEPDRD